MLMKKGGTYIWLMTMSFTTAIQNNSIEFHEKKKDVGYYMIQVS